MSQYFSRMIKTKKDNINKANASILPSILYLIASSSDI